MGVTREWGNQRQADAEGPKLPDAVLPVYSHIHLVDAALRNSSRWNQQTHACTGTTGDTD